MVDAYALMGVAATVGLLPSLYMLLLTAVRWLGPKVGLVRHKEDKQSSSSGHLGVTLLELKLSRRRLRWGITYTCLQVGFMVTVLSVTPLLAWSLGASRWNELAAILGGISDACWPGCSADMLSTALVSLRALQQNIQVLRTKEMYSAARTPKHTVVQEQAEQTALRDN